MTDKTQATAHAEITAPISADLRGIEQEASELPEPSPTAGMNLGQRILHVGGRENAAGYIEFGSVAAVRALVGQVLRDLPSKAAAKCLHQGAAPAPVTYMATDNACKWAWDQVREEVGTEGWTAGDSCTFYGFFLWGWHYRGQYETQRPACPPAPAAVAVPNDAVRNAIKELREKADECLSQAPSSIGVFAGLGGAAALCILADCFERATGNIPAQEHTTLFAGQGQEKCVCTFAQRVVGDGCRHCNPQEYIDRLHKCLDEYREEADTPAQAQEDARQAEAIDLPAKALEIFVGDDSFAQPVRSRAQGRYGPRSPNR